MKPEDRLGEESAIWNVDWKDIKWTMEQLRKEAGTIEELMEEGKDFGGRLTVEELVGAFISLFHKYKDLREERI